MAKHIESARGLAELLRRYQAAGVTDETKDESGSYSAKWLTTIKQCIAEGLAMDETDYENTPHELRRLWQGLR